MTTTPVRSMFVTVLSWAFIGLGAIGACFFALFSLVSTATQHLALAGNAPIHHQMLSISQAMQGLPPPWPWIYAHESQLLLLGSAVALLHLACALGMLWRRRWARVGFIALMLLDILLQLAMIPYAYVVQPALTRAVQADMPAGLPPVFAAWMQRVMAFQHIEAMVRPVLLIGLFAWIAWRLHRASVRQEFAGQRAAGNGA
jgi:hypothetical protein